MAVSKKPKKGEPPKRKKASGPTQPEDERTAKQKKLRWTDKQSAALAQLAARWGLTESEAAARAVAEALGRG